MNDDNMSNEIVNCFNGKQCIYDTACPMYNAALGICRLEPLKTYKMEGIPEKPKTAQAQKTTPQTPRTSITIPYREEIPEITSTWNINQYGKSANSADYPELVAAIKASYQERLDYGDFYFKLGGDTEGFINYSDRTFRDPDGEPSEGQVKLATQRKIIVPANVTKKELSVLISEADLENRRNK